MVMDLLSPDNYDRDVTFARHKSQYHSTNAIQLVHVQGCKFDFMVLCSAVASLEYVGKLRLFSVWSAVVEPSANHMTGCCTFDCQCCIGKADGP